MGWNGCVKWTSVDKTVAGIKKDFNGVVNILAEKLVSGVYTSEFWTVCQISGSDSFIMLFLIEMHNGSYMYKIIEEREGPYFYGCPLSFFNIAPETNPDWRQKVRKVQGPLLNSV